MSWPFIIIRHTGGINDTPDAFAQRTSPRIRRLEGLFAPGIFRVFKFVKKP